MRPRSLPLMMFAVLVTLPDVPDNSLIACDCHQAHAISLGVPSFGGVSWAPGVFGTMSFSTSDGYASAEGMESPLSPSPPGTLGQTYTRLSHPIPSDEHPRTAMLAVRDSQSAPHLTVQNMGGFRMKNGVWLFESSRPLDPGACQIVRVEARQTSQDVEPYDTRFVRLIPGRIVYLDF
jgi:hypothetical protein